MESRHPWAFCTISMNPMYARCLFAALETYPRDGSQRMHRRSA